MHKAEMARFLLRPHRHFIASQRVSPQYVPHLVSADSLVVGTGKRYSVSASLEKTWSVLMSCPPVVAAWLAACLADCPDNENAILPYLLP